MFLVRWNPPGGSTWWRYELRTTEGRNAVTELQRLPRIRIVLGIAKYGPYPCRAFRWYLRAPNLLAARSRSKQDKGIGMPNARRPQQRAALENLKHYPPSRQSASFCTSRRNVLSCHSTPAGTALNNNCLPKSPHGTALSHSKGSNGPNNSLSSRNGRMPGTESPFMVHASLFPPYASFWVPCWFPLSPFLLTRRQRESHSI